MREVLTVQVGGCGIRAGNAFWRTVCQEHEIDLAGERYGEPDGRYDDLLFRETQSGRFVPRAILTDLDKAEIEGVRSSKFGQLYDSASLFKGNIGSGSTYAAGYYGEGKEMMDEVMDCS